MGTAPAALGREGSRAGGRLDRVAPHHRLIRPTDADVLRSAAEVGNLAWALLELAETAERRLAVTISDGGPDPVPAGGGHAGRVGLHHGNGLLRSPGGVDHGVDAAMTARSNRSARRGSLLVEVAMAAVLLMIAMALTVKVLGFVARRAPGVGPPAARARRGGQPDGANHGVSLR